MLKSLAENVAPELAPLITSIFAVADKPESKSVIVTTHFPNPTPVTEPSPLTIAIFGSLDIQTVLVNCASSGDTLTFNVVVVFFSTVTEPGSTEILFNNFLTTTVHSLETVLPLYIPATLIAVSPSLIAVTLP